MVQTLNELRLHDQKTDFQMAALEASGERTATAVEKFAATAAELRAMGERMEKRNGEGLAGKVNAKNVTWLVGLALMAGIALGSGNEVATLILHRLLGR